MGAQAQVGDTVRLTVDIEGVVQNDGNGRLHVKNYALEIPEHTVEILSRATPPLPSEPDTWWLDDNPNGGDVWLVNNDGDLRCMSDPNDYDAATLGLSFRQLVLK